MDTGTFTFNYDAGNEVALDDSIAMGGMHWACGQSSNKLNFVEQPTLTPSGFWPCACAWQQTTGSPLLHQANCERCWVYSHAPMISVTMVVEHEGHLKELEVRFPHPRVCSSPLI